MAGRTVQMLDYHWNINSCLIFFCRIVCLVSTVSSVLVFTTAFDTCVIKAVMSFAPTKRNRILFRNLSIFPRCRQARSAVDLWSLQGASAETCSERLINFKVFFLLFFPFFYDNINAVHVACDLSTRQSYRYAKVLCFIFSKSPKKHLIDFISTSEGFSTEVIM